MAFHSRKALLILSRQTSDHVPHVLRQSSPQNSSCVDMHDDVAVALLSIIAQSPSKRFHWPGTSLPKHDQFPKEVSATKNLKFSLAPRLTGTTWTISCLPKIQFVLENCDQLQKYLHFYLFFDKPKLNQCFNIVTTAYKK